MEAYTLVGCFDSNVSDRAANRCGNEMRGTDSGSLVRLMKALAKLGQDDEQLFGSIARELNDRGMHLLPHQVDFQTTTPPPPPPPPLSLPSHTHTHTRFPTRMLSDTTFVRNAVRLWFTESRFAPVAKDD